jgi:pilus assembly protein Flp/PilA
VGKGVKYLMLTLYGLFSSIMARLRPEEGQTMAEYGLLLAVIAIVVVVAALLLGSDISALFNKVAGSM